MTNSFRAENAAFEDWLRKQCCVVEADLKRKHDRMRTSAFAFLRATFFRWARTIEAICPDLNGAPRVLTVGDAHLENYGTWRDAEGRLVWGINDFDEAAVMPYPFDLVRLAASAQLAPGMPLGRREVAAAILEGYANGLAAPRPTLLDEQETWMRPYVVCSDKERRHFWKEVDSYPQADPPKKVAEGLEQSLPKGASILRFATPSKGGGSLGRPRYVAIAAWRGGHIVREAKALVPSAWDWAHAKGSSKSRFFDLVDGRYRSPDPFLSVHDSFVFRRIAADSRKVELGEEDRPTVRSDLLMAMGFDLGAVHAARKERRIEVRKDLEKRPRDWLYIVVRSATKAVEEDFRAWV